MSSTSVFAACTRKRLLGAVASDVHIMYVGRCVLGVMMSRTRGQKQRTGGPDGNDLQMGGASHHDMTLQHPKPRRRPEKIHDESATSVRVQAFNFTWRWSKGGGDVLLSGVTDE